MERTHQRRMNKHRAMIKFLSGQLDEDQEKSLLTKEERERLESFDLKD